MRAEHLVRLSCLAALALSMVGPALAWDKVQRGAGASAPAASSAVASAPRSRSAPAAARLVDLNTASRAELMKLPGIGEAEAMRIVRGRPYKSKADLVTKNVLDLAAYDQLRQQVAVDHRRTASRPRPGSASAAPAGPKRAS